MKAFTVDRIEDGRWMVLEAESGEMISVPAAWGPEEVAEGDVLRAKVTRHARAATVAFVMDEEAARGRRQELEKKRRRLRRGPGGDLRL